MALILSSGVSSEAKSERFANLSELWPSIYERVKDTEWFRAIAIFYFSADGYNPDYTATPVSLGTMHLLGINEQQQVQVNAMLKDVKSPYDPRWWILPYDSSDTNGLFLYLVMMYSGFKVNIYTNDNHTYLRNGEMIIVDLFWQQFDNGKIQYENSRPIHPFDLWINGSSGLGTMLADLSLRFIFTNGVIDMETTNDNIRGYILYSLSPNANPQEVDHLGREIERLYKQRVKEDRILNDKIRGLSSG